MQKQNAGSGDNLPVVSPKKLSKEQISNASDSVRANLVDVLLKISSKLASLPNDSIGPQNLAQVSKLTDTAAKLFAWPHYKPLDASEHQSPANAAINLALIHTTPEQLRNAAKAASKQTAIN
jgi:hypothetical protein